MWKCHQFSNCNSNDLYLTIKMDTHWKRCKNNISKEMICLKQIIVLKEKNGNFARNVGTGFAHKNTHVYLHLHVLRTRGICWFDTGKSVVYHIFFDGKICTYYIRAPEFPRSISLILPLSRIPVTPLPFYPSSPPPAIQKHSLSSFAWYNLRSFHMLL